LLDGKFVIFNPAAMTLTGAVPSLGVVAVNNVPHAEPSPATPPAEFTQLERISANVFSCATGTVVPAGRFNPGAAPVVVLTYSAASVKALASTRASVVPDPMLLYEVINGASAHTAATVVNSFMLINVEVPRFPHGPSAAISAIAALLVPGLSPGFPPVAVTYTRVDGVEQLYKPVISKFPLPSLLTGWVSSGVATDPSPVVPTAYNCRVAPVTGCWPPCTLLWRARGSATFPGWFCAQPAIKKDMRKNAQITGDEGQYFSTGAKGGPNENEIKYSVPKYLAFQANSTEMCWSVRSVPLQSSSCSQAQRRAVHTMAMQALLPYPKPDELVPVQDGFVHPPRLVCRLKMPSRRCSSSGL
jgi:hypothetical protein